MSYAALYRKWRPISFDSVVGQEAIIRTLTNQIRSGRIAHAYLFCGTRGTGKTTTAKIFSRAVNCEATEGDIPCNVCSSCRTILDESNMDVIEMDAASNNGVDDIRELRENVKYPPSNGKYKVYIIDEVHMLSKGAFNALLKTLEEPPPNVMFILATTEPHKIPPTIHSRCQRFDFKRVPYDSVRSVLSDICVNEGRTCQNEALDLIVQCSEGAMRDALSLLDRCLSFETDALTHDAVLRILGLAGDRLMIRIFEELSARNIQGLLDTVREAVNDGKDLQQTARELVEFSRKLMILHVAGNTEMVLDISMEVREAMKPLISNVPLQDVLNWLTVFSQLEAESRWTPHPRALIEKTLIQLVLPEPHSDVRGLLERVTNLEAALRNGVRSVDNVKSIPSASSVPSRSDTVREKSNLVVPPVQKADSPDSGTPVTASVAPIANGNMGLSDFQNHWNAILTGLKKARVSTYALLIEGRVIAYENPYLTIAFDDRFEFHRLALERDENRSVVEAAILQITGNAVSLRCVPQNQVGDKVSETSAPEWEDDVRSFFKGHESKIEIKAKKEEPQ